MLTKVPGVESCDVKMGNPGTATCKVKKDVPAEKLVEAFKGSRFTAKVEG